MHSNTHASDQELLLITAGELAGERGSELEQHLKDCAACRDRRAALESSFREFSRARDQQLSPWIPPIAKPRALLRGRLSETPIRNDVRRALIFAASGAACALALLLGVLFWRFSPRDRAPVVPVVSVPDRTLTPGLAALVPKDQICGASPSKNRLVPVALRRRVFEEYGIQHAEPQAYEVDYLITPALGGADDIRNLWPQSYSATLWNARVKDALEDRLHDLVCEGQLDLATAQRDIAADWVGAYKKYFHTDRPLNIQ